jgi:malonyl-CoA decarboxylase
MGRSFFHDLLVSIAERGRELMGRETSARPPQPADLRTMTEALLSGRGEASGVALAQDLLAAYANAHETERAAFLRTLARDYGPDHERLEKAARAYLARRSTETVIELTAAAEPRRQEVIRRLNRAPGGTAALIRMREHVLDLMRSDPELAPLDLDFAHLLTSWFNRGFLVLRRIDWTTPANILEKITEYEAVHTIRSWHDLRNRLEPPDRRCYAFFHPQIADDPLIFVEIALTRDTPDAIAPLLDLARAPLSPAGATTAVFYSISNCQRGLAGISFGNFLIKQVVEELKRELPRLTTFVTLSPVPGFAQWLTEQRKAPHSSYIPPADVAVLKELDDPAWPTSPRLSEMEGAIMAAAAAYFLRAKTSRGKPIDPVARFHLGNGARLERINFLGDTSTKGLRQSYGVMVNYLYDLPNIESNHEAYAEKREVVASSAVRRLLRAVPAPRPALPAPHN